jgi:hypothetical protein
VDTANLIDAALVGFVEGDHDGEGAIGQTDSSLDRVSLELRPQIAGYNGATMLAHTYNHLSWDGGVFKS